LAHDEMFMLNLLDNLPHLQLSDDHMKTILWVIRECGILNVPSLSALWKLQACLTKTTAMETHHHTSSLGNHFYMNHPLDLLALPGQPHTCQSTIEIIETQIRAACTGVQDAVDAIQMKTSVKDMITQFWLGKVITKACELQVIHLSNLDTRDERLNDHKVKGAERESIKDGINKQIQGNLFILAKLFTHR
ncbi:hypothetical protein A0H81_14668, partial [Grifola frondosa]